MYDLGDDRLLMVASRPDLDLRRGPSRRRSPTRARCSPGCRRSGSSGRPTSSPNHLISSTDGVPDEVRGRALRRRASSRCSRSSASCAATSPARAGRSTRRPARSAGSSCPPGLRESEQLPEPIFTPATKAEVGDHDENVDFDRAAEIVGDRGADGASCATSRSRSTARAPSTRASAGSSSPTRSSSSAATRDGELVLGDEVLTPDSSRFWPADGYEPGRGAAVSFDKQYVRDWATASRLGQDAARAGAPRRRRRAARARSTSRPTSASPASRSTPGSSAAARVRARVLIRPKEGILDPRARRSSGRCRRSASRASPTCTSGRLVELDVEDAGAAARAMCEQLLANPLIEDYEVAVDGAR